MISDTNLYDINIIGKTISIFRADEDIRGHIWSRFHNQPMTIMYPSRNIIYIGLDTKIDRFNILYITEKDYDFIYKTHDLNILSLYIINLIKKNDK
jgi:hypothetical protein